MSSIEGVSCSLGVTQLAVRDRGTIFHSLSLSSVMSNKSTIKYRLSVTNNLMVRLPDQHLA